MAEEHAVRILIADGQALFREAVRVVLESEEDLEVSGEAGDGVEAVAQAERVRPDVALIDAALSNCDGIRATELITEKIPDCKVLILAAEADQGILIQALEAGASGYLTKESPLGELIEAARAVRRGETLIPGMMLGGLLASLIQRRRDHEGARRRMEYLTRREREVLALLAKGADNDGIAQALVISPQTARTHVQNILGKLEVHSRLEAAAFVTQNGILEELEEVRT
jgi:DNA-binding NarL/FixJ family response regulator